MFSFLSVLFLLLPVQAQAINKAELIEHLRESYQFPADLELTLGDPKPSEVPGFDVLELKLQRGPMRQEEQLYISKNGRHYILGGFRDIQLNPDQQRLKKMDLSRSAIRGDKKAPVTLVEYTDFQCPYCQKGYEIVRYQILKEYGPKVRWIYKSLPLKSIHPWAEPAAIAVECAKLQSPEKFWKLHDVLFEKQREINQHNLEKKLNEMAKTSGLDTDRLSKCIEEKTPMEQIRKDMAEAEAMGITGTPAFIINGHLIPGADYVTMKQVIEESLKGKHGKTQ